MEHQARWTLRQVIEANCSPKSGPDTAAPVRWGVAKKTKRTESKMFQTQNENTYTSTRTGLAVCGSEVPTASTLGAGGCTYILAVSLHCRGILQHCSVALLHVSVGYFASHALCGFSDALVGANGVLGHGWGLILCGEPVLWEVCYKETQLLGMHRQSETRAGNHQGTHARETSAYQRRPTILHAVQGSNPTPQSGRYTCS